MPVTVSSTRQQRFAATPLAPRIRTAAAGPVLGPIGAAPREHHDQEGHRINNTETFTPIACNIKPVAQRLRAYRQQCERDQPAPTRDTQDRQPSPESRSMAP